MPHRFAVSLILIAPHARVSRVPTGQGEDALEVSKAQATELLQDAESKDEAGRAADCLREGRLNLPHACCKRDYVTCCCKKLKTIGNSQGPYHSPEFAVNPTQEGSGQGHFCRHVESHACDCWVISWCVNYRVRCGACTERVPRRKGGPQRAWPPL